MGGRRSGRVRILDTTPPAAAARLYDEYGAQFVSRLNGSFAGLIYDRDAAEAILFTDRFGTRPIHHIRTASGVVFSTDIQSLPRHPDVDPVFDVEYLAEYFTLQRSFGVKTPLEGVELLPLGSITTVDLENDSVETTRYWGPHYEPVDRPRSYFVDRLASLVEQIVEERTHSDASYGLLLSGGSDSRLVLAGLTAADRDVHTYHLNEWENQEATIARRVATTVGADFTFLKRDREYPVRVLESTAPITNFVGYFNQVHAAGFADRHLKEPLPEPHWTRGPWPDHDTLIRTHSFVRETLDEHREDVRALPFLDADGVEICYQRHLDGATNLAALYSLVTFLKMPVVEQAVQEAHAPPQ